MNKRTRYLLDRIEEIEELARKGKRALLVREEREIKRIRQEIDGLTCGGDYEDYETLR